MEGARTSNRRTGGPCDNSPECLESMCMERISAFQDSADPGAFQAFYSLSLPLFSWYAGRLLGGDREKEVDGLLARFYAFLCEEALSPTGRLPRENLLGWCKAALANLVELHLRGEVEEGPGGEGTLGDRIRPVESEIGLRERTLSEPERVSEGIAEVLARGDAGLTEVERRVLSCFYRNGRDLSAACKETGLSEELAHRVLGCARGKVYLAFFQGPGRFLPTRDVAAGAVPEAGEVEG